MSEAVEIKPFFEKLPLDDARRPITTLDSLDAQVPEASRKFLNHKIDRVRFPNGNEGWHHRVLIPEGVMLAHLDEDNRLALATNYRHALGRFSREIPSGGAEPEERSALQSAVSAAESEEILRQVAIREFREEVGLLLGSNSVRRLIKGPLQGSVGFADQQYHLFIGEGGQNCQTDFDDGEKHMLVVDRYAIDEATEMVGSEVVDPASSVAILKIAQEYGSNMPAKLRRQS